MKIALMGGSGFIGNAIRRFFEEKGHEVVNFSRHPKSNEHYWDPETQDIELKFLEGSDVIINLAGDSIMGRWTDEKLERIRRSRFLATRFLAKTILKLETAPKLYIGASAIGYYGDDRSGNLTEESSSGEGVLAEIARTWESLAQPIKEAGIRTVFARLGIVLGKEGGALKKMKTPFSLGLGGVVGNGKQFYSWISIDDLCRAIDFVIEHKEIEGPVNFTSPNPVTNRKFTKTVGEILHRPTVVDTPKFALHLLMGKAAVILLSNLYVVPEKLLKHGFVFTLPNLEDACRKYLK